MDLSVIVCTYNRSLLLTQTLTALAGQAVPAALEWEILVVDNNSNDDTCEVTERFIKRCAVPARYLFEPQQGLCYARNCGIANARGELLAFTDDDVTPEKDWIATLRRAVDEHPADGVGGRILPKWSSSPPEWITKDPDLMLRLAMSESSELTHITAKSTIRLYGANMAFRRKVFRDIGDFDVRLDRIGTKLYSHGDVELVRRAVTAGKVVVYDPRLVVWHWVGPERMQKRYFRQWSFDDAEGEALRGEIVGRRHIFGIPLHLFDSLRRHGTAWLVALVRRDPTLFRRELQVIEDVGYVVGSLRRTVRARNGHVDDAHAHGS